MESLQKAINTAVFFLNSRMRTCKEVYDKLLSKGYDKDTAEKAVEELVKVGYLNDRTYAMAYINDGIKLGAKGIYRIRQELIRKGISSSIIEDAIADCEEDTYTQLKSYVEQRNLCENIHSYKDLEKLKARLVRRGYSLQEIKKCLGEYEFHFEYDEYQR